MSQRILAVFTVCVLVLANVVNAEPLKLETYLDLEQVGDPQISPDGEQIIFTRSHIDKMNDRNSASVWIMNADGSKARQLMSRGGNVRWSPDGTRIAFISADDAGKPQLFIRWMDAEGAVSQITHGTERPRGVFWSPDGQSIAFMSRVPRHSDFTVKLPGKPAGAKWKEDPLVVEEFLWHQDRIGPMNNGWDHVFVVTADGGTPRQLTSGNWHANTRRLGAIRSGANLSWTPDGNKIIFDGLAEEDDGRRYTESYIYSVDVQSKEIKQLTDNSIGAQDPVVSPDGEMVAFTAFHESVMSYRHSNMYVVGIDGSNQRRVVGDLASAPASLRWASNSRGVYFALDKEGDRNIHYTDMNGNMRDVTEGDQNIFLSNVSDRGVAVALQSDADHTPDVVRFNLSNGRNFEKLTNVNADIFDGVDMSETIEFWYDSTEGTRAQGWAVLPPNFDSSKKYPMILSIHGGPHAMYRETYNFMFHHFAAQGYVVLFTNPRGSTGYGEDFAAAIENIYPGPRDFADLMGGVDHMIEQGYVDEDRLFVTGCSGGGILTAWTITQTDRFKAAASRCVVSDWIGMVGTTDVSGWMINFFEKPFWEDPTQWYEHSAIMHSENVKTPTLFMTGDLDRRTPDQQAKQMYAVLKYLGVPTKFISVKGEYHGTGSIPSNYLRRQLYLKKWFDMYDPAHAAE
ncbi:S9 family peptidase [Kordiimonas aquimaris]|uniref:S9 family peptidase n=1 Tax=Kordiimonas aquimaris TaxID=707591 RepID=UPI0021D0652A|nr:S9 family peptidase [Kordiimonas aquimaris]